MEEVTTKPTSSTTEGRGGNESNNFENLNFIFAMEVLVQEKEIKISDVSKEAISVFKTLQADDFAIIKENVIKPTKKAIKEVDRQKKAMEEAHEPNQAEQEKAEAILNSENPPKKISELLNKIIAGEEKNKLIIFTLLLSGKSPNPKEKQIILIKGESGGGKTTLMKLAEFYRTKSVARFTPTALDYTNLADVEILKIKELNSEEKQGVGSIKFLSSEDKGYSMEYTMRGEDGRFKTEKRDIPAITLITSTTTVELDAQLERRAWILNPDTTQDQTLKILKFKAERKKQKDLILLGLIELTDYEKSKKTLGYIVKMIKPAQIIIPFMDTLISLLKTDKLRVRGDIDKILSFIAFYHWLYQEKLPITKINGKNIIFANPEVTMRAIELIREPLMSMQSGIEARELEVLNGLKNLGITQTNDCIFVEDRIKLMKSLGFTSEKRIRVILNKLEDSGYFTSTGGVRGNPKVFFLTDQISEIKLQIGWISGTAGQIQNVQKTKIGRASCRERV